MTSYLPKSTIGGAVGLIAAGEQARIDPSRDNADIVVVEPVVLTIFTSTKSPSRTSTFQVEAGVEAPGRQHVEGGFPDDSATLLTSFAP